MKVLINKTDREVFLLVREANTVSGINCSLLQSLTNPDKEMLIEVTEKIKPKYDEIDSVDLATKIAKI